MLNALQQSEENHGVATLDTGAKRRVLNALRQSEENHGVVLDGAVSGVPLVLNALRQSEENHRAT